MKIALLAPATVRAKRRAAGLRAAQISMAPTNAMGAPQLWVGGATVTAPQMTQRPQMASRDRGS